MSRSHAIVAPTKSRGATPSAIAMALDTLAGVRGEMARLYRLGLNGQIRSDEMTRFIYVLREIRACLEAEILTDVQQRLALLSRDMDNHNGHRVLISRLSQAVDLLEQRLQQNRPLKVVKVRRGLARGSGCGARSALSRPTPRIATRISRYSIFTMMRKWPTRAKIAPAGRRQRNLKTATHDVSNVRLAPKPRPDGRTQPIWAMFCREHARPCGLAERIAPAGWTTVRKKRIVLPVDLPEHGYQ